MLPLNLPIDQILPRLKSVLGQASLVVLQAPPGAGKSTALPLALLDEPWLSGQRVVMLQPRRLAVRAVAARLAEGLGEDVGQSVGYRVRFESRGGPDTRLEVVTEGILTRRLQRDPELSGIGLVILDEFHERSLHADLALALLREVQEAYRPDLKVLVMSATLDPALPEKLSAPLVASEGRSYPVALHYAATDAGGSLETQMAQAVRRALTEQTGDILAFLPGRAEIQRTQQLLQDVDATVLPLYGELPLAEQRRALQPDPKRRKVVLATNIAETSLTIEGVRVVIDGGYSRQQQLDAGSGLSRLHTTRVTADAATQRAGRAGRTQPGVAYRLWTEATQALLRPHRLPEILEADLSSLVLELAQWGAQPQDLPWLDPPPLPATEHARGLLRGLEALDEQGRITSHGHELLRFPTHPRLAHLLLSAPDAALAADVAALLEERDPFSREQGADLSERIAQLRRLRLGRQLPPPWRTTERLAQSWRRLLKVAQDDSPPDPYQVGALVALAFPEWVAQRRSEGPRYLLASGGGAELAPDDDLQQCQALAVARLDARSGNGRIFLAAPLDPAQLRQGATWHDVVGWDSRAGVLVAQRELRRGALRLETQPLPQIPPEQRQNALLAAIREEGLGLLPMGRAAEGLARVQALRRWNGDPWPDWSPDALLATLEDWLPPYLGQARSRADLAKVDVSGALLATLPWPLPQQLAELAPTHLTVPSGSRVRLDYSGDGPPVLAVKLQELFGLADTPTVNGGRVPVLLHLLSPAGRPVQVTQDLRSFWNSSYFEVRKDLRGRYPKHPWPDDPWSHQPTRLTKARLQREG